jgi:hypothetical protein
VGVTSRECPENLFAFVAISDFSFVANSDFCHVQKAGNQNGAA